MSCHALYDLTLWPPSPPKSIHGRTYYYARECQRVDGKPKIVKTTYLGSLDHILQALTQAQTPLPPQTARLASFGDVAALYDQAQQSAWSNSSMPKSPSATRACPPANTSCWPPSTAPLIPPARLNWPTGTTTPSCPACCPPPPTNSPARPSGTTWTESPEADIEAIEQALSQRLIQQLNLSLRTLVYDGTNFFTFINTRTPARLPARGHNKQHRGDLRQVSLGMLVSTDFHVPLFHLVYTRQSHRCHRLSERLGRTGQTLPPTGPGVRAHHAHLRQRQQLPRGLRHRGQLPFHFIGSLVPSQHPDLLRIPLEQFQPLAGQRLASCLAYRTGK